MHSTFVQSFKFHFEQNLFLYAMFVYCVFATCFDRQGEHSLTSTVEKQ